jgi:magnesium-transporting ATPase (P-type)
LGWVEKADLSNIPETIQYFFFGHIPGKILMPEPNTFRSFEVSFKGNEFTVGPFFDGSSLGLVVFALMLALFILLWMKNKIRKEMFLLGMISFGTMLLLIVFSWAGLKLYVARYFMPVAVIIYLLLAGMLTTYFKNKNAWFYCLLVYVLLILLMNPIKYDTAWYQFLNSGLVKENEEVVVDNPFSYASAKYYLGEDRVKLYNRYNPKQDFSLWIIIDQEDIITDLDKIKNNPEVNILDDENCDWQGVELKETADFKNLKFCSF